MRMPLEIKPTRRPDCPHCKGVRGALGPGGLEAGGLEREVGHQAGCPAAPGRDRRLRRLLSLVVLATASGLAVPACGSGAMSTSVPQGLDNGTVGQAQPHGDLGVDEAA